MDLPVLKIGPSEGEEALLNHKLTTEEQIVFKAFDSAVAQVPKDADQSEDHRLVAKLGEQFGLTPQESIAFWIRTTFMIFEAEP